MAASLFRSPSVDDLIHPDSLARILEASSIRVNPTSTGGYSGADFFEVLAEDAHDNRNRFVLKITRLAEDWFSRRTGDLVGREAMALLDPGLEELAQVLHLPYRAVAVEDGRLAILMDDVSDGLLPDERKPLASDAEALIIDRLARLHALFWEDPRLESMEWLHTSADFLHVMGPLGHDDNPAVADLPIQSAVREGWKTAADLLPNDTHDALRRSPDQIAADWSDLPHTLVHGDTKVANFAILPDERLCALDWAFVGRAPCTCDIGWYIAVNASRLTGTRESTLALYRSRLETHLGCRLGERLWGRLEESGIVCGALMLLWSKATGVQKGREGADPEWAWWMDRLSRWTHRIT